MLNTLHRQPQTFMPFNVRPVRGRSQECVDGWDEEASVVVVRYVSEQVPDTYLN